MQLHSINVGRPVTVEYSGKEVTTSIFKSPVDGPVNVARLNLQGDEQSDKINHGGGDKAVYAFSLSHYERWEEILDRKGMPPGTFGENLTVDDFNEADIGIGDQLALGDALFEVAQPRVPCFKLAVALAHKQAPKWFTAGFKTGVYLRVLEEGSIAKGDQIRLVKKNDNCISVESLFRAFLIRISRGVAS